jgi:hypothetical protein
VKKHEKSLYFEKKKLFYVVLKNMFNDRDASGAEKQKENESFVIDREKGEIFKIPGGFSG